MIYCTPDYNPSDSIRLRKVVGASVGGPFCVIVTRLSLERLQLLREMDRSWFPVVWAEELRTHLLAGLQQAGWHKNPLHLLASRILASTKPRPAVEKALRIACGLASSAPPPPPPPHFLSSSLHVMCTWTPTPCVATGKPTFPSVAASRSSWGGLSCSGRCPRERPSRGTGFAQKEESSAARWNGWLAASWIARWRSRHVIPSALPALSRHGWPKDRTRGLPGQAVAERRKETDLVAVGWGPTPAHRRRHGSELRLGPDSPHH